MTKTKKIVIALLLVVAVAAASSLTTLAVTNYGSQSDPLVTLSYLNDTLTPAIREEVNKLINDKAAELTSKFNDLVAQNGGGEASGFVVLTLNNGQTVTCGVGAEILPRLGSVVSDGPDNPRLVDETDGTAVTASGTALTANHLYMVTIKGNGVKATANNTKILIKGEYTVS